MVRCRTDTFLHNKIPFADLNPELVHYSDNMHQPDGMINDWFDNILRRIFVDIL